ncbi:hypothetical protein P4S68_04755 [Pseudoalteromonas sp. Hal099]
MALVITLRWVPKHSLIKLLEYEYEEFTTQKLITDTSFEQFKQWFDLTGIQRHLKAWRDILPALFTRW